MSFLQWRKISINAYLWNEIYKFEYDSETGVILEFSKSDGVDRIRGEDPNEFCWSRKTTECDSKEVRAKEKGYF
jgi:hypothetical protein